MKLQLVSTLVTSALLLAGACFVGDGKTTQSSDESGDSTGDGDPGDGDGDPTGDGDGDPTGDGDGDGFGDGCTDALDILLVVDNSGSMGMAQGRLLLTMQSLVAQLDGAGLDWRIGVTTSDNGNPWCPAGQTTPESGKLVMSSCTTRLNDFLFGNDVDVRQQLCHDFCPNGSFQITPSVTEVDASPKVRPWIERIDGQTNVSGLEVDAALRCTMQMGVNGCGFESQLESTFLALSRMQSNTEDSYGFLRGGASLLVVIVSDEADCSSNPNWHDIFNAAGNKAFWSDPSAAFPTSAVCWNAGVACTGDPSNYDCNPQDYDVNRMPTDNPDNAVMRPISRYIGLLDGIRSQKQAINPGARVRLVVIGGVGPNGTLHYADVHNTDPAWQDSFGIGPGCTAPPDIAAVPPVRMRDVALQSDGSLSSICDSNFSPYVTELVQSFVSACG